MIHGIVLSSGDMQWQWRIPNTINIPSRSFS